MKKIVSLLFALFLMGTPMMARANILYLDCFAKSNCDLCDAVQLITKIVNAVLEISGAVALLFFVIAGVMLLTSQGVPGRITTGKKMIFGSLIGIGIVYFAWTGVNFIIYSFGDGSASGQSVATIFTQPWNELRCIKMGENTLVDYVPPVPTGACKSPWEVGNALTCGGNLVGFVISGINPLQSQDASPALVTFLTNMDTQLHNYPTRYGSLTKSMLIITSVSDDHGLSYCRDYYSHQCTSSYETNCCYHTQNSCHYGHGATDGSYALDFRAFSGTNVATLNTLFETLVRNSGGNYLLEGDHTHVSTSACTGY